jgi:hypothetical protein
MQFQFFSDDFLNKWLSQEDKKEYVSMNDRKLKAGVNWLTAMQKSSFQRYDSMWLDMKEKCLDCMKTHCQEDYDWILKNAQILESNQVVINSENYESHSETGFKKIKFPDKETGKIGYEKYKNFNTCKKKCYEKINIMNVTLGKKLKQFSHDLNICLVLCRGKPFDRENVLSDCYSDCMIKHSKDIPTIEYFIKKMYEQIIMEYKENKFENFDVDLLHNYRFKPREFDADKMKKYL